jgi:hypothetical protein
MAAPAQQAAKHCDKINLGSDLLISCIVWSLRVSAFTRPHRHLLLTLMPVDLISNSKKDLGWGKALPTI